MKSRWSQSDLDAVVAELAARGVGEDRAIRTYTTRILGREPRLVLHGGGNTSVKTRVRDALGAEHDVLCVKGSGWDMAMIEPEGLPAVELAPLAALADLDALGDEELVAAQRRLLLDPYAPNPSIEAVLHAIIPARHVDHTHANAIISLTNQPDGEAIVRDLLPDATIVPYVMPGFVLAQLCRRILKGAPDARHLILMNHGVFTFHDDPRQSYEVMIRICDAAERRLDRGTARPFAPARLPTPPDLARIAPVLRGALARETDVEGRPERWVLDHRTSEEVRHFVDGAELADYATRGNAAPDHSIRIKRFGMVAPAPDAADPAAFAPALRRAVAAFARDHEAYFERNARAGTRRLDPVPRVVYVPAVGLFGVGETARDAAIAADIAEATVNVVTRAEGIGTFAALPETDLFDIEHWSLEQAKLAEAVEKPMNRQVAVVTGAAGGLGREIARSLRAEGAEVAVLDRDAEAARRAAGEIGGLAVTCDVTDGAAVEDALAAVVRRFGGVDVLISNAGAAFRGRLTEVGDDAFRRAFEFNFWGHHHVARACARVMKLQGTGGAMVFNVSKQALNPGPDFGPYGTAKAALMALMRQYAVELGGSGIAVNAVNADRIRTGLLTDELVAERARARGITPDAYMRGNLLRREVTARDVAEAFVHLAEARATSGAILTVDGGNVAAMVR